MKDIEIIINREGGEEAYYLTVDEALRVYRELKKLFSFKEEGERDEEDI